MQGEHSYTVEIDWDGGFLEYECSCPYFADRGYPCKHIWATLLDADERGKLPRQDELEEMSGSAELPERPQQPPVWKQRLSTLRAQMNLSAGEATDPWPAGRESVYAIDWDTSVDGGGLCIELLSRARRRDGQWERPKSLKHLSRSQLSTLPEPLDRQILQMLAGAALSDYEWGYGDAEGGDLVRQYQLASTAFETILKPMCDTGRCFLRRERALHTVPLTWDDGEPWEFVLGLARDGNSAWKVEGSLVRVSERIGIETPDLVVPGGLIFLADRVAKLNDGRAFDCSPSSAAMRSWPPASDRNGNFSRNSSPCLVCPESSCRRNWESPRSPAPPSRTCESARPGRINTPILNGSRPR